MVKSQPKGKAEGRGSLSKEEPFSWIGKTVEFQAYLMD
jgi:hypothetical protein